MSDFQLHNVKRVEDGMVMLGLDVSLSQAIAWCRHYNSFKGRPYPNRNGYYDGEYVVIKLDVDLCEYLTLQ